MLQLRQIVLFWFISLAIIVFYPWPSYPLPMQSPNSILIIYLRNVGWLELPINIPIDRCNALAQQWLAVEPKVLNAFCVDPGVEV